LLEVFGDAHFSIIAMPNPPLVTWEYCTRVQEKEGYLYLIFYQLPTPTPARSFEILAFLQMPAATGPLTIDHWNKM